MNYSSTSNTRNISKLVKWTLVSLVIVLGSLMILKATVGNFDTALWLEIEKEEEIKIEWNDESTEYEKWD